jgi:hypothetical protein
MLGWVAAPLVIDVFMCPSIKLLICSIALGLTFPGTAPPRSASKIKDRRVFARAMGALEVGMSGQSALRYLGPPDDMLTAEELGAPEKRSLQKWAYGTAGHRSFPTLGAVYLEEQRVTVTVGGDGEPPREGLFDEQALRRTLGTIERCLRNQTRSNWNPTKFITAVNTLQQLGKERSIAVLREWVRVSDTVRDKPLQREPMVYASPILFPLMRTLFLAPTAPEELQLDQVPLLIKADVPLLLEGEARGEFSERQFLYYQEHGQLQRRLLSPPENPLSVLSQLPRDTHESGDKRAREGSSRRMTMDQLLRMLEPVCHIEPDSRGRLLSCFEDADQRWEAIVEAVGKRGIRWNAATNGYTFMDGGVLPIPRGSDYRRHVWNTKVEKLQVSLRMLRGNPYDVVAEVYWSAEKPELDAVPIRLRIRAVGGRQETLAELAFPPAPAPPATLSLAQRVRLPLVEGAAIRAELQPGGTMSPVYRP